MENQTVDLGNGAQATIDEQGQLTLTQTTFSAEQAYELTVWLADCHFPMLNTIAHRGHPHE